MLLPHAANSAVLRVARAVLGLEPRLQRMRPVFARGRVGSNRVEDQIFAIARVVRARGGGAPTHPAGKHAACELDG